jgi:hypothetical protein
VIVNGVTLVSPLLRVTVAPGGSLVTVTSSEVPWNNNMHEHTPSGLAATANARIAPDNFMLIFPLFDPD